MAHLTKDEVIAYQKRWQFVNEAEIAELRNTTLTEKLRRTAALMASTQAMGWQPGLDSDKARVWERWQELRKKFLG